MLRDNPIVRRELIAFLRSRKALGLFVIFLSVLAGAVYFGWPLEKMAVQGENLSKQLFAICGAVSLALIVLFVPSLSAGAITMEREMNVMDILKTAPLSTGAVLRGKLLSALIYIVILLLSSLPIVSLCLLLGAIAFDEILGLYILLVSLACFLGMIGICCSCHFERSQGAYLTTYLISLPIGAYFLGRIYGQNPISPAEAIGWTTFFAVAMGFIYLSAKRGFERPETRAPTIEEERERPQAGLILSRNMIPDKWILPARSFGRLGEGKNLILDKEFRCEIYGRGTLFIRILLQGGLLLSLPAIAFEVAATRDGGSSAAVHHGGVFLSYLLLITSLTVPALTCNSITQEWERGTLDLLLTTPLPLPAIIEGKFRASLRLAIGLNAIFLLPHTPLLLLNPTMWGAPHVFAAEAGVLFLTLAFLILLSILTGIRYQTTVKAMGTTYLVVFLAFALPFLVLLSRSVYVLYDQGLPVYYGFSPFVILYAMTRETPILLGEIPVPAGLFGVAVLTAACALLWGLIRGFGPAMLMRPRR